VLSTNPEGPENWENVDAMTSSATTGNIPRVINEWSGAEGDEVWIATPQSRREI
jgi:hypothetical protein